MHQFMQTSKEGHEPEVPITKIVVVPDEAVGRLIGKQGTTIRQIQDISGAHVDIAKEPERGTTTRVVTLKGTPSQLKIAEDILNAKVVGDAIPVPDAKPLLSDTIDLNIYVPTEAVGR